MFMMGITSSHSSEYSAEANKFVIPDFYHLDNIGGHDDGWQLRYYSMALNSMQRWPWDKKIEKAIFRG
jgi:hypothetical protein